MMKSLLAANRSEKDSFRIPHSVQQSIPIRRIFTDGIWQVGQKYSKTWRFSDINYAASSLDDRRSIFRSYGAVLNSLPTDATAKITIINRRLNPVDFQRTMLMPECSDGLDYYRGEYNQIILDKAAESNNLVQEKYITLSIGLRKIEQTRAYFRRVDTNLSASFGRLDSGAYAISCADRLRLLHDFFRPGEEASFRFDLSANIKRGIDFRDLICPDGLQFRAGYFEMGGKFGRVLFMRDYASFISDEMIKDLSDFSRNLLLSIDILPIPTEEAVREVQSRILGVETDITRWQQRQNRQNNFTATVPYDLEQMRTESKDLLEDLTARDQRLMFACVTLVHIADSLEQLDADTQTLQSIAQEKLCGFSVLRYQQEDGLNTVLPYGLRRIHALRTLTTESCAVLMPFRAQEIQDPGGLYYGVNAISKNLLICDRKRLISPHAFYLGVSGSGKSVAMKNTIANVALSTNDDIIIIDAEREYAPIARALGGEVIEISPNSQHHINPLDLQDGYEDGENPIAMKSELITSILEQQMGAGLLTGSQKSIIDRCTASVYQNYFHAKGALPMPLLSDWRAEVLQQPDPEAREIALAAELITEGSLNVFAHPTNVDINNRIVVLDLYEMGEQLRPTALVVALEAIQNRVMENRKRGKYTWVFLDEVYLYFKYKYSGEILYRAWKRFRKYGAALTAASQNVEECLKSETARLMFANSEFLLLFNQAATDRAELSKLLHISDTQLSYITNAEAGHGLLRMGGSIVPFVNTIPRQTALYMCGITTATQTVDVPDSDPDDDVDDSHTGIALTITITAKTAEQMRLIYVFTKYQNDALDILLENLGSLNIPMGSLTISQEDAIALLENLPDDLDPARKAVVETAVQLVGRVSYFWGGKSLTLGWDDRWGVPTEVTASGSGSTGTIRPFGLDCSGFVDWSFYNATNGSYYPGRGGGAATQHSYCTNIAWNDAQPGDLVFYPDDSHVGIVGGKDADGNLLIVHCSGGANGVVVTGSAGFTSVARPDCFS